MDIQQMENQFMEALRLEKEAIKEIDKVIKKDKKEKKDLLKL